MMRRTFVALAAALSICAAGLPANAGEEAPLVGTWQITSYQILRLDTQQTDMPMGEHPIGYFQFSPGGHYAAFFASGDLKSPHGVTYTDAERVDLHKKIIAAHSGTYSVDGNRFTVHVLAAWVPSWIGTDQGRNFEVRGNNLTIRTDPFKWSRTGPDIDIVSTLTFERVE